jgi:hypothetical protein
MKAISLRHLSMWHVLFGFFMFTSLDNAFGASCAELQQEKQALLNRWNAARSSFAANPYGGALSNWQVMAARLGQLNSALANCNDGASQQPTQPRPVDVGTPTTIGTPTGSSNNDSWTGQTIADPALAMAIANALAQLSRQLAEAEGMTQMLPKGASLSDGIAAYPAPQPVLQPPADYADDKALQILRDLASGQSGSAPANASVTPNVPTSPQGFDQTQLNNLRSNVGGLSAPSPTSNTSAAPTTTQQPQLSGYQACASTFANPASYCQMGNIIYFQNGRTLNIK